MSEQNRSTESDHELEKEWSHVGETINMLYLAVCQIESTMGDANQSVEVLTKSFTKLASHTSEVSQQLQGLNEVDQLNVFKEDLSSTASELQSHIASSVEAFQFYDRVCQRIDHVARSLEQVSGLLSDKRAIYEQQAWKDVQANIKSSYSMEAERIMFEYIMRGGSVQEALEIYKHHFNDAQNDPDDKDEIELF